MVKWTSVVGVLFVLTLKCGAWELARKRDGLRGVLAYLTGDAGRICHLLSGSSMAKKLKISLKGKLPAG